MKKCPRTKWEQVDAESLKLCCLCSVCQHGTFQCVFHPCPSMCMAYGDRHYRTFDGLLFDYVGACKVYLVKVLKVFIYKSQNCGFTYFKFWGLSVFIEKYFMSLCSKS